MSAHTKHTNFFRKKCAKPISLQGAIQSESFTRKPRRNELFHLFGSYNRLEWRTLRDPRLTKQCRLRQRGGSLAAHDARTPGHLYALRNHDPLPTGHAITISISRAIGFIGSATATTRRIR